VLGSQNFLWQVDDSSYEEFFGNYFFGENGHFPLVTCAFGAPLNEFVPEESFSDPHLLYMSSTYFCRIIASKKSIEIG
jgi:hypothetical protein